MLLLLSEIGENVTVSWSLTTWLAIAMVLVAAFGFCMKLMRKQDTMCRKIDRMMAGLVIIARHGGHDDVADMLVNGSKGKSES